MKDIKLIEYSSLEELEEGFWGISAKEIYQGKVGGFTDQGEEIEIDAVECPNNIKRMGLWGYSNFETTEIHYWVDEAVVSKQDIIEFFAHEYGHFLHPYLEDLKAEQTSENYASAAVFAYQNMTKIFDNKKGESGNERS